MGTHPIFESDFDCLTEMAYPKQEGFVQPYEGPAPLPGGNSFPADLDEAIKRGHQAGIGHFLINNPDQINLPGFNGQRPIHMACYRGDDKLVKKLVDHGADVNLGTNFGETPIISAAQAGSLPLFDYLLNNGANAKATDQKGAGISHYACRQGFIGLFHHMVNRQLFDFEARDSLGNTTLHEALEGSRMDLAQELINYRPDLARASNGMGDTAMHVCARKGSADHHKFAWRLLERFGSGVLTAKNLSDQTPVGLAEDIMTGNLAKLGEANNVTFDPNQQYKSNFALNFAHYRTSNAYVFVGAALAKQLLWVIPKIFYFAFVVSATLAHFELFNNWTRFLFAVCLMGLLMYLMRQQSHRVPHPSAQPNPVFKAQHASSRLFITFTHAYRD